MTRLFAFCLSLCLSAAIATPDAKAQGQNTVSSSMQDLKEVNTDSNLGFRRGSFVAAPIPFSNPMIGSGLSLGLGYLFKTSPNSDTSVLGVGGLRSDNGSQGYAVLFNLALPSNRWKIKSFAGEANLNYDLFLPGAPLKLPIKQDGIMGRIALAYGFNPDLSLGGAVQYLDTTISSDFGFLPPELQPDLGLELLRVGLVGSWDTRDNTDYATKGFRATFELSQGTALGSHDRNYTLGFVNYDRYHSFGPTSVLAVRAAVCGASGETPFFEKCSLGTTDSFRGFNMTQFLDRRSASVQAEFRQRLGNRFGLVGFVGAGWTGPSLSDLTENGTHVAGGAGIRYRVSKKFPVDFSVDYVRNDLEEGLVYIYVGQRF